MIIDFCAHCGPDEVAQTAYNAMNKGCFEPSKIRELADDAGIEWSVVAGIEEPLYGLVNFARISPSSREIAILKAAGMRIFPTYERWDFDSRSSDEIFSIAQDRGLIVQVCLRLQDPRVLRQSVTSNDALKALSDVVKLYNNVKFAVGGANLYEIQAHLPLFKRENVWADIAHLQHPVNSLEKLLDVMDSQKILFATNSPVFYPKTAVFRVVNSKISDDIRERILWKNARGLLDA